jgi:hypothetical protein
MNDFEYELRDELINSIAEQVASNPQAVLDAGFGKAFVDVLTNLTPASRTFIHEHFFELFEFDPGTLDAMKQRLRPN